VSAVTPRFVFRGRNGCTLPALLVLTLLTAAPPVSAQEPGPTRIILDASPRAIEYQLGRLTLAELTRVERKAGDPRYRPVYLALLTRKGIGREYFEEALTALMAFDKGSRTAVLLEGLARVPAEDEETAGKLLRALLAQPADALRNERGRFTALVAAPDSTPLTLRAAYGGLLSVDADVRGVIDAARGRDGHLAELLRAVPHLGSAALARAGLADAIVALLPQSGDAATRAAAIGAIAAVRPDAATFTLLARETLQANDPLTREAGVRALRLLPRQSWPAGDVEPLARSLLASLGKLSPEARVEPAGVDAIQLVEGLTEALPDDSRRALRRDLRALGVRVVPIQTVPEQMMFDLRWFVVEAAKPVQIVLTNPDAMSHNLLVIKPGGLKEVGTAAGSMSMPSDPAAKPYVPATPLVLQATRLLNWAESERLNFVAPTQPGEYPFACTFPGHWVRMYGVMLVVENLDAWEAKPTVPLDPMTGRPYDAQRQ
jgi:azurin